MKKIPTVFERKFKNHKIVGISPVITAGCERAFYEGVATVKYDGSCTAVIDGEFFKRFDAKPGRRAPDGAIPCCEADAITGHHPHWVKVDEEKPENKWFAEAYKNYVHDHGVVDDGTYEAVGRHFNGNPYRLDFDTLVRHGDLVLEVARSFEDVRHRLGDSANPIEGIVFWVDGEPVCKIKRTDFGFKWPVSNVRGVI